jgi:hypothetical protein
MINPASLIGKINAAFGNIEQFNANVIASVSLIETQLGPGTATANLELVKQAFNLFNADIGTAGAFVQAFEAPFEQIVALVSQLRTLAQNLTKPGAVQPTAPAAAK